MVKQDVVIGVRHRRLKDKKKERSERDRELRLACKGSNHKIDSRGRAGVARPPKLKAA